MSKFFPPPAVGEGRVGGPGMASLNAQRLRSNPTAAERALWGLLRRRQMEGLRVRRQVPIGPYVADFVCFSKRTVIEVDGGQHAQKTDRDTARTRWLESQGFNVLRFWNTDVLDNPAGVLEAIRQELCDTPHPNSPLTKFLLDAERAV